MLIELVTVRPGEPRHAEIVADIVSDPVLVAQMWTDAEHRPYELPALTLSVALVRQGGRWVPAAWAGARVQGAELLCGCCYEVRGAGRDLGLFALAYRLRHREVVLPWRGPAVTYLFSGRVVELHEADGWARTGEEGPGEMPEHRWWELRRPPACV